MLLLLLGACSDEGYQANVTELRLVRVYPTNVFNGDIATILGRNFALETQGNKVYIDDTPAEVIEASKDELKVILPAMAPGEHTVRVATASGDLSGLKLIYLKKPDHEYLVQTVVGRKGVYDLVDGIGTEATTKLPSGLAFAPDGSIWFTDRGYNAIRRISPNFEVTTLLTADLGSSAVWQGGFNSKGEYYFIDKPKGMLRKVNADKSVTTVASGMSSPMNVCFDAADNMYVSARDNKAIYKFTPDGTKSVYADLGTYKPNYCTFDARGNLIIGLNGNYLLEYSKAGELRVICGDGAAEATDPSDGEEGNPLKAHIGPTFGVCCAPDGSIYYADQTFHTIRRLVPDATGDYAKGTLETVIGTAGKKGYADGKGLKAVLTSPYEVIISKDGSTMYFAEAVTYVIRRVSIK